MGCTPLRVPSVSDNTSLDFAFCMVAQNWGRNMPIVGGKYIMVPSVDDNSGMDTMRILVVHKSLVEQSGFGYHRHIGSTFLK